VRAAPPREGQAEDPLGEVHNLVMTELALRGVRATAVVPVLLRRDPLDSIPVTAPNAESSVPQGPDVPRRVRVEDQTPRAVRRWVLPADEAIAATAVTATIGLRAGMNVTSDLKVTTDAPDLRRRVARQYVRVDAPRAQNLAVTITARTTETRDPPGARREVIPVDRVPTAALAPSDLSAAGADRWRRARVVIQARVPVAHRAS
jgi:hypothetical protein